MIWDTFVPRDVSDLMVAKVVMTPSWQNPNGSEHGGLMPEEHGVIKEMDISVLPHLWQA